MMLDVRRRVLRHRFSKDYPSEIRLSLARRIDPGANWLHRIGSCPEALFLLVQSGATGAGLRRAGAFAARFRQSNVRWKLMS